MHVNRQGPLKDLQPLFFCQNYEVICDLKYLTIYSHKMHGHRLKKHKKEGQHQSKEKMKPWKSAILLVFAMTTLPSHAQNSRKDYLDAHNAARSEVGVAPMNWSSTLEAYAIDYANQRAGDCQLIHSRGPYGENIYMGYGKGYSDGIDAVRYWYNEKPYYDHGSNQCLDGMECLHYTQMVWRSSVRLGCARVQCDGSGGQYFITCNYDPPGNMVGERPYN